MRFWFDSFHQPHLNQDGADRDGPVAAHGRIPTRLKIHDSKICALVGGRYNQSRVHIGIAARLMDEKRPKEIQVGVHISHFFNHCGAGNRRYAADDDPLWISFGVSINN